MTETVFVTGATGLLGSNLTRDLVASGRRVRALVRSAPRARALLAGLDVEFVEGDMGDVGAFAAALEGVGTLFHTAAHFRDSYKGGRHWDRLYRVNVEGTRALLEAAYRAGVRRVVHTSSVAVVRPPDPATVADESMRRPPEGEPDDYYRSKIMSDREVDAWLARHPDARGCFVLPGFMNGPGDAGPTTAGQMVLDYLRGALPGVIDAHFSYVDARDVALAHLRAAERGRRGERYLVAGRRLHVREAFALLEEITGVPAPRRAVPTAALATLALAHEAWARLSGRPVLLSWQGYRTLRREGGSARFDSSKAERELGVSFRPLRDTFADAVAWFIAQGKLPQASLRPGAASA